MIVPPEAEGGRTPVRIEDVPGATVLLEVGSAVATGLHQVDNPVFDRDGNLYVTYSGTRGQEVPVSIFRVTRDGVREPFATGIVNPTSMAFDRGGPPVRLEPVRRRGVPRAPNGDARTVATDLGIACGLAFDSAGMLYVGDRSGTVFAVAPDGAATLFATLPASVAAFHLAFGPDDRLYVTAPTLAPHDSLYRIDRSGHGRRSVFRLRPSAGAGVRPSGSLYVVDALAGGSGLYRLRPRPDGGYGEPERVVGAPSLIGVAVDPSGGLVVASNETVYRLEVPVRGS